MRVVKKDGSQLTLKIIRVLFQAGE